MKVGLMEPIYGERGRMGDGESGPSACSTRARSGASHGWDGVSCEVFGRPVRRRLVMNDMRESKGALVTQV